MTAKPVVLTTTCANEPVQLVVTTEGVKISEHVHTEPNGAMFEEEVPRCESARDQAMTLRSLWGLPALRDLAAAGATTLHDATHRLVESLHTEYELVEEGEVRRTESIRRLSPRRVVHVSTISGDDTAVPATAVHGPYPNVLKALDACSEAVTVWVSGTRIECETQIAEQLPERVRVLGDAGWLMVDDQEWEFRAGAWLPDPEDIERVASWDNGDNYGAPGGDRLVCLARFGEHYSYFDDSLWQYLNRYKNEDQAIRAWARLVVPGGYSGYCAYVDSVDEDEDEDEDDYEDDYESLEEANSEIERLREVARSFIEDHETASGSLEVVEDDVTRFLRDLQS